MLDVKVPHFFSNLTDLIKAYLEKLEQEDEKELVNSIINNIQAILTGANTSKVLNSYISEQIKAGKSAILIVALLHKDYYDLFKSSSLQKHWDDLWISCGICKENKYLPPDIELEYIPFPHQHSLDLLISNFLCNEYHNISEKKSMPFINTVSFLAYAAVYGSLPAIERTAYVICNYLGKNEHSEHEEALTFFLLAILKESAKTYLHMGLRLQGFYLIHLAKTRMSLYISRTKETFLDGIRSILIATKLEEFVGNQKKELDDIMRYKSFTAKTPLLQYGQFMVSDKKLPDHLKLIEESTIIYNNFLLDGYYCRGVNFETVIIDDYRTDIKDCGLNQAQFDNFLKECMSDIVALVQEIVNSRSSQPHFSSNFSGY